MNPQDLIDASDALKAPVGEALMDSPLAKMMALLHAALLGGPEDVVKAAEAYTSEERLLLKKAAGMLYTGLGTME